jgi:hypothetical protein
VALVGTEESVVLVVSVVPVAPVVLVVSVVPVACEEYVESRQNVSNTHILRISFNLACQHQ